MTGWHLFMTIPAEVQALPRYPSWEFSDHLAPSLAPGQLVLELFLLPRHLENSLDTVAIPEPFLRLSPSERNQCVGCGWAFSALLSLKFVLHHLPWSTRTLWSPSVREWKVHLECCCMRNTQFEKPLLQLGESISLWRTDVLEQQQSCRDPWLESLCATNTKYSQLSGTLNKL